MICDEITDTEWRTNYIFLEVVRSRSTQISIYSDATDIDTTERKTGTRNEKYLTPGWRRMQLTVLPVTVERHSKNGGSDVVRSYAVSRTVVAALVTKRLRPELPPSTVVYAIYMPSECVILRFTFLISSIIGLRTSRLRGSC